MTLIDPFWYRETIAKLDSELDLMSESARWEWLREAAEEQERLSQEQMAVMIKLEAFKLRITQRIPKKHWDRFMRDDRPLEGRLHELRLRYSTQAPLGGE